MSAREHFKTVAAVAGVMVLCVLHKVPPPPRWFTDLINGRWRA